MVATVLVDPRGYPTTYQFSESSDLTSVTDALGHTTTYTREASTNLVTSVTDPLNRTTAFTYDANGNVLIPSGATVRGRLTQVDKSGHVGETGILKLAFEAVSFGGKSYPMDASVVQANPQRSNRTPVAESAALRDAARAHDIAPVFIAPPNADEARLRAIGGAGEGYTYVTSREGVTGADERLRRDQSTLIGRLRALGAPPPVLGFGISNPDQVRGALAMGAAGVICGSAVVQRYTVGDPLGPFVAAMKAATRR